MTDLSSALSSATSAINSLTGFGSTPPTSQKAADRKVSFYFASPKTGQKYVSRDLYIRPEDIRWSEPSRIQVSQTLSGAWVDNWGEGLKQVTISGTTGWRGGSGGDWSKEFQQLYNFAFSRYHSDVADSKNPSKVWLYFMDGLNGRYMRCVPSTFELRRNKSRPLLVQYHIVLVGVENFHSYTPATAAVSTLAAITAGLTSLSKAITRLTALVKTVDSAISGNLSGLSAVLGTVFGSQVQSAFSAVLGTVRAGASLIYTTANTAKDLSSVSTDLVSATKSIALATRAALQHLANETGLTDTEKALLSSASSQCSTIACLLSGSLKPSTTYPSYDSVYGASNCSSTNGGHAISSYADSNAFSVISSAKASTSQTVSQNAAAISATTALVNSDPVLYPLTASEVASHALAIASGTSFSS